MAIDTRSKRASSVRFGMPWMIAIVLPDGTIDEQVDRQHQAWVYSGILAGLLTLPTRKHHIRLSAKTITFRR